MTLETTISIDWMDVEIPDIPVTIEFEGDLESIDIDSVTIGEDVQDNDGNVIFRHGEPLPKNLWPDDELNDKCFRELHDMQSSKYEDEL